MSDNLFDLYSQKILSLAMEIPHQAPLSEWQGESKERSPVCGSQITVRVCMENNCISAYSQDVKACALGQASATIFGRVVIGQSETALKALEKELTEFLTSKGNTPSAPFEEYECLAPAQDYKNRHASIMLPIKATLSAINETKKPR